MGERFAGNAYGQPDRGASAPSLGRRQQCDRTRHEWHGHIRRQPR